MRDVQKGAGAWEGRGGRGSGIHFSTKNPGAGGSGADGASAILEASQRCAMVCAGEVEGRWGRREGGWEGGGDGGGTEV